MIHQAAFRPLFVEVLRLAGAMGMVKLGNLSTDGTKMGANASRHKAMSYGYMNKEIERLKAKIEQQARKPSKSTPSKTLRWEADPYDELPAELKRREERLAKIPRGEERDWKRRPAPRRKKNNAAVMRNKPSVKPKARKRRGKEPAFRIDPNPADKRAKRTLLIP